MCLHIQESCFRKISGAVDHRRGDILAPESKKVLFFAYSLKSKNPMKFDIFDHFELFRPKWLHIYMHNRHEIIKFYFSRIRRVILVL